MTIFQFFYRGAGHHAIDKLKHNDDSNKDQARRSRGSSILQTIQHKPYASKVSINE